MDEAVAQIVGEFEVSVLRCGCGKPRSHAPYIDGERFKNFARKLRAWLLRRPLINVPCPTPRVEQQVFTKILTPQEVAALGG